MIKNTFLYTVFALSCLSPLASLAETSGDQFLGKCAWDQGDFLVYQNKEQNIFRFEITNGAQKKDVVFDKKLVRLAYDADASYWKFRNGRNNGVFSWNYDTGIGHLKYVEGEYFYWSLTNCNIDERDISN